MPVETLQAPPHGFSLDGLDIERPRSHTPITQLRVLDVLAGRFAGPEGCLGRINPWPLAPGKRHKRFTQLLEATDSHLQCSRSNHVLCLSNLFQVCQCFDVHLFLFGLASSSLESWKLKPLRSSIL